MGPTSDRHRPPGRDGDGADRTRRTLAAATAIAAVATAGSLWFSLGLGLVPCELCWYQRIAMYPLVVVLGVATLEGRPGVVRTALPLALGGLLLSTYHSWLQYAAARAPPGGVTCGVGSCGIVQYTVAGLTIPNLAGVAFAAIAVLLLGVWRRLRR